jgi:beta-glucanase (GH16 family)
MKFLKNNNKFIMKILITIISLLLLLTSVGNANEWTLVWSDEFNYEGRPDSDKWQYEKGFVRNEELGYFTDRLENVRVEGEVLVIEAYKETIPNEAYIAGSTDWREEPEFADYTTGSILTRDRKEFKYGRFEVRAKMPAGAGSHVGIWFSGANGDEVGWPECGEIDIMEYVGRLPDTIHIFNHYAEGRTDVGKFTVMNPYDNFHIYAMEWDETQIKYFIDNMQVATFNLDIAGTGSDNPFRKEQIFRLSYSLGGWGWGIDDNTLPKKLEIDYVRVYHKEHSAPPTPILLRYLPSIIHPNINKKEQ